MLSYVRHPIAERSPSAARELLVEIFVTHRTEQRKIDMLRERRLPTIEIDLSKTPRSTTEDDFKRSVLYEAKAQMAFNYAIHDAEAELRKEAEKLFGGIGASLNAAYEVEFVSIHNRWKQDIEDAGVRDQVGTHVPGTAVSRSRSYLAERDPLSLPQVAGSQPLRRRGCPRLAGPREPAETGVPGAPG